MKFEINKTPSDFAHFCFYVNYKKRWKRMIFIVAFTVFLIHLLITRDLSIHFLTSIILLIGESILFIGVYALLIGINFLNWKRVPLKGGIFLGTKVFEITDEGFSEEGQTCKTFQKWEGIQSIESNQKLILLFVDATMAHVIPKREFTSVEEQTLFIETIKNKVNLAKHKA